MNIPSLQLQVAMGIPLFAIPEIRDMFGQDRALAIPIPEGIKPGDNRMVELCDVDWNKQRSPEGHVIAVRVTAENAENGFTPTSGQISELTFRTAPQVIKDTCPYVSELIDPAGLGLFCDRTSR